jgi:2-polyprenyl-6-methoxyphenol hydroxylase-like FAD-dependent oxidoreductase
MTVLIRMLQFPISLALRPVAGQGGALAFEDAVVLCRCLARIWTPAGTSPPTQQTMEQALHEFENIRLPRVRTIWDDQWERAERVYQNEVMEPWTPEFEKWVYEGV